MVIATPRDKEKSLWTKGSPSTLIVRRVVALAKESLDLLGKQLNDCATVDVDFKTIFRPTLDDYDVVIWLKKEFLPCIEYSVDEVAIRTHKHKSHYRHKDCLPVTGFNPAITFLADLKSEYDDMAMFFHDVYGGQCITVVWRQSALEQESFKVRKYYEVGKSNYSTKSSYSLTLIIC
jgi:U3 small nucleolar RNA-associated protein 22